MSKMDYMQPIIRGIQSVGAVKVLYRYNNKDTDGNYKLPIPSAVLKIASNENVKYINCGTGDGINVAGFRLDSEFLRANPQIASSFVIPILGGGGIALTNNNRTGSLNLVCTRVAPPDITATQPAAAGRMIGDYSGSSAYGVKQASAPYYYDMVTLAQIQQAQAGGDDVGANLTIKFYFCGILVTVVFENCTVASVDPLGMAGNDAVNYAIVLNYLNWTLDYTQKT